MGEGRKPNLLEPQKVTTAATVQSCKWKCICYQEDERDEAVKMLTGAINAYVYNDEALAKSVIESDDIVDDLFLRVKTELTDMIVKDSSKANSALDLLMIAKYMERIADHATNIAEWVVFSITGVHKNAQLI